MLYHFENHVFTIGIPVCHLRLHDQEWKVAKFYKVVYEWLKELVPVTDMILADNETALQEELETVFQQHKYWDSGSTNPLEAIVDIES